MGNERHFSSPLGLWPCPQLHSFDAIGGAPNLMKGDGHLTQIII